MSENNNAIFRIIKKTFRFLGLFILALLILANLFILLSGRFYLYKGIAYTYLSGKTGPTIYDQDKFFSAKIDKSSDGQSWSKSPYYTSQKLKPKELAFLAKFDTKAYLVFKGKELVFEQYWDQHTPKTLSNSFSGAKTVVALLIGIAVDEGKIKSLDDKVGDYIPEFKSGKKGKITVRHLLMMASGLDWQESAKNPLSENAESYYGSDLYGLVTRQHAIEKPGKRFEYQSGNSQLLGIIVEKATGMDLSVYAQQKIWDKIGAESDAYWSLDKEGGDEKFFCCMYATARDFGRLGKLIAQDGRWNDRQVISKEYMLAMKRNPDLATEEGGANKRYGLHIWTYYDGVDSMYYCRGILGQYIISIPSKDLVIVRLGSKRDKNFTLPEHIKNKEEFIKRNENKLGHPGDLFTLISIGKRMEKELEK